MNPTPEAKIDGEPGFEIVPDRTMAGFEAFTYRCTACDLVSTRYGDHVSAERAALMHLRFVHHLPASPSVSGQPTPQPDNRPESMLRRVDFAIDDEPAFPAAFVRDATREQLAAGNARLRSQLAEARAERYGEWELLRRERAEARHDIEAYDAGLQRISGALHEVGVAIDSDVATVACDAIRTLAAERDSLREERDRLVAEVDKIAADVEAGIESAKRLERLGDDDPPSWQEHIRTRTVLARRLRALAAAPVEAPASLPESKFQPRNLDSAGDDSSQLAFPAGVPAEPDVDEFVYTPAGRAWLAGVSEREASRPDPVPDSREEIEARLKAAAAPVQPEERPGHKVDCGSCCCCSIDTDQLRAALATAERQRDEARRATDLANEAGKYGTAIAKHIQDEHDALRAEVQRIAAELRKWSGAEISAPASTKDLALDTAHRLVAALGSTPDTGSE